MSSHTKRAIALSSLIAIFCSTALTQTSTTVHGPEFVKAGETFTLVITVDRAPNFSGSTLYFIVRPKDIETGQGYGIQLDPNKTEYSQQVQIPEAAIGGTWSVTEFKFGSGMPGSPLTPLPFTKYSFQVIPKKGLVYPTSAAVGMRPSQTQLLRTEAIQLQARIQELKGQILEHKSDSKLTKLLRENIRSAIQALDDTEQQFRSLDSSSKQEGNSHVFFDDLRTSYRAADHLITAEEVKLHNSNFLRVAAQQKAESGIYPLVAQPVLRAFEQNELAYNTVADAQSLTFDLEVSSYPAGATVSFKRRGDEFKKSPNPTDSTIKALTFAIWIVRFEKEGFLAIDKEHNPFVESNHAITVQLPKVN